MAHVLTSAEEDEPFNINNYIFRPHQHLDSKWLHPDFQDALFRPDKLNSLFNILVQDKEVYVNTDYGLMNDAGVTARLGDTGKYYCGLKVILSALLLLSTF